MNNGAGMSNPEVILPKAISELMLTITTLIRRTRTEMNDQEFSWAQSGILARLAKHGQMTSAQLARAEGMKPQSMASLLPPMEERKLIKRCSDPSDGRKILFELTKKGIEVSERLAADREERLRVAVAKLGSKEQETLLAGIALINRTLEL
jgi:DNA-binding MarR family transcriptional regulator